MIKQSVSLASNGVVKVPGYEQLVRFGYTKNRGVYRLHVDATGEWEGLAIRAFWHVPDGKDPLSSLVVDGYVDVPASVTAQPGNGCITFEGSDGTKTMTSADLRYRVSANSGTEDGTEPEPGTPAWQQLVDAVHTDAATAEQAKTDAQTAAQQAEASAKKAGQALSDTITAETDALKAIGDKQTAATQAVDTARDKALKQVEASTEAAQTAASEAATSAGNASQSAAKSSAAASNANASAENAARAQVAASQLAGQAADSASEAQNSATKATASQQAAESNAAAAQESATKADASASTAVQGQQRAEAAATRAQTAQQQTESASTDALDKISSAKTDALKALDTKQTSATTAVEGAKGKALDAVTDAQDTATQAVQAEQASATTAVKKAGAEVLTSIPEDYQTTVQKVKELDAQKVETDDAISAVKVRQNILIGTETGNPIAVDDAFPAPLCGLTVYGRSTQDGTPTPDAPVPIVSAGDGGSVAVKVTGRNILDMRNSRESYTGSGVTYTRNADYSFTRTGTAADKTGNLWLAGGFNVAPLPDGSNVFCTLKMGAKYSITGCVLLTKTQAGVKSAKGTNFTPTEDMHITGVRNEEFEVGKTYNDIVYPAVYVGAKALLYEPYREQLLTLPTPNGLPGIPVTSGGNYIDQSGQQWVCDEVDLERGVKVQRIKTGVISSITKSPTGKEGFVQLSIWLGSISLGVGMGANAPTAFCNRALNVNQSEEYNPDFVTICTYGHKESVQIRFNAPTALYATSEEFSAALMGATYSYALATPIETPLTPAELAAYKALTADHSDTVVQAGDGAGIKLVYQRDVNIAIKRIEDAVASMT